MHRVPGAGLIMYMIKVLLDTVGAEVHCDDLDKQHLHMMDDKASMIFHVDQQGMELLMEDTERRGNLFSLTCIVHTNDGQLLKECMDMALWYCSYNNTLHLRSVSIQTREKRQK